MTSLTDSYTITFEKIPSEDPRLGRHVLHDSRSLLYQVEAAPLSSLKSIRHQRFIPVLDQNKKNLGSCPGNAAVGCVGTGLFWDTVKDKNILSTTDADGDEEVAINVYSEATKIDPFTGTYPPTDTGSNGLSVAKVLASDQFKWISGYQHATSLEAALTALSKQPIITGTDWLNGMFTPDPDGRLRLEGTRKGGHEYVLDELDVERKWVWMTNSWNPGWGVQGRAYITWDDYAKLLANRGDVTVFTPLTQPAPTPSEPPPPDPKAEFAKSAAAFEEALHKFLGT